LKATAPCGVAACYQLFKLTLFPQAFPFPKIQEFLRTPLYFAKPNQKPSPHYEACPGAARCGSCFFCRCDRLVPSMRRMSYHTPAARIVKLTKYDQWNDCLSSYNGTSCSSKTGWECLCTDSVALDTLNSCVATACSNSTGAEGQSLLLYPWPIFVVNRLYSRLRRHRSRLCQRWQDRHCRARGHLLCHIRRLSLAFGVVFMGRCSVVLGRFIRSTRRSP
jgi:hypothetical protein